jgi:hypothetical protein
MMLTHLVDANEGYRLSLREIGDFLTAKNPRFHASESGVITRMGVPHKVAYRIPQLREFVRLIAKTEDRMNVAHLYKFIRERVDEAKLRGESASRI